ncbi:hypothetical protein EMIHUDRAFT_424409 [Emiliania huxleyi CCMP1516]|uniref:Uncharacterized protein n=2 Tax=Emiliania huxleyi TaxID=2903 RepID=A0A0D3JN49_EMIH1|nr:hypothetical protein EMIHUDRAFT_424409 [Emiliania huxleyi CCMP1516]EOD24934.1 hypothetical protein EMIHUDRAFT_424409 [Emiliania huxleyi CCMP1516]|eukprot:XP_005777363.1 hypothetical protein EMIHUDRAFT_424409 [Emiliania huxleyi CCMP1516]
MEVHASGQTSTNPNPTNLENVGLSRATSPKRQKKNSNLDVPRCGLEPGGDWRASGLWPEDRKGGPARARAGQGWRMGSSGRVSRLAAAVTGYSGGARLRRVLQPLVAASEGASLGGSDAGTAGFASNRRRGDPGV